MSRVKQEPAGQQEHGPIELGVVRDLTPQQQKVEDYLQQAEARVRLEVERSMAEARIRADAAYERAMDRIAALPPELANMPLIELEKLRKQQAGISMPKKASNISSILSIVGDKLDGLPMYDAYPEALGDHNGSKGGDPNEEPACRAEGNAVKEEQQDQQKGVISTAKDHVRIIWESQADLTEEERQKLQQRVTSTLKDVVSEWHSTRN